MKATMYLEAPDVTMALDTGTMQAYINTAVIGMARKASLSVKRPVATITKVAIKAVIPTEIPICFSKHMPKMVAIKMTKESLRFQAGIFE